MDYFNDSTIEWRPATYNYEPIGDGNWFISENGTLYNEKTKKYKVGHDNVKGKDLHQRVTLSHKSYYVSRIVAEAFVFNENPDVNIIVRHLNDNPLINRYTNLKWGTHQENTYDAIHNKKIIYENHDVVSCEDHGCAVLTNKEVIKISKMLKKGVLIKDIASIFGVDVDVIRHIYKGKSWRDLTEKYLPFPEQELLHKPLDSNIKKKIIKYIKNNPTSKPKEIIENLCLDDTNKIRQAIRYLKHKNQEGSTTRES